VTSFAMYLEIVGFEEPDMTDANDPPTAEEADS
jgi:hypothetical protein